MKFYLKKEVCGDYIHATITVCETCGNDHVCSCVKNVLSLVNQTTTRVK